MRRIICAVTAILLLLSLCACGSKAPENSVNEPTDLSGKKIGVLTNSAAGRHMNVYDKKSGTVVTKYDESETMTAALTSGTIDCIVADERSCNTLIPISGKLKVLKDPFFKGSFAIAVAKENAQLTADLNAALAVIEENGTLEKIIDSYLTGKSYVYESTLDESAVTATLTLAIDAAWPPYEYYGENGELTGIDIDVARALCDVIGVGLEITVVEPGTLIEAVNSGRVAFAMGCLIPTEEYRELVDFTNSYLSVTQQIIVRKK